MWLNEGAIIPSSSLKCTMHLVTLTCFFQLSQNEHSPFKVKPPPNVKMHLPYLWRSHVKGTLQLLIHLLELFSSFALHFQKILAFVPISCETNFQFLLILCLQILRNMLYRGSEVGSSTVWKNQYNYYVEKVSSLRKQHN